VHRLRHGPAPGAALPWPPKAVYRPAAGRDPIWGAGQVDAGPYIDQFPLRSAIGIGISLLEAPGKAVTVVGHTLEFDPVRKRRYCDLQLDAGRTYPSSGSP